MTSCTPIYGFTYALCSDPPCDIGATFCLFAEQVEAQFDRLDGVVDRTVDTIPFASIGTSVSQVIGGTGRVFFDTVNADTDNMVDLSQDATLITINRPGTWIVSFSATVPTLGSGAIGSAFLAGSVSVASDGYMDNGVTTPYFPSFSSIIRVVSAPVVSGDLLAPAAIRVSVSNGSTTTVTTANLTVAWVGDE